MAEQDPPFTEEEFKSALYDALMEGRVMGHQEAKGTPMVSWDVLEELYSGTRRGYGPAIAKLRRHFTRNTEGDG